MSYIVEMAVCLQAGGYAFFRTIEPLAHQASAADTAAIVKILYPGNPVIANAGTAVSAQQHCVIIGYVVALWTPYVLLVLCRVV